MSLLQNKIALVTGGGRGIGRAIAIELAQVGCDVAILSRTEKETIQVKPEIEAFGRRCVALSCDVADSSQVTSAHTAITQKLGKIDILINNAGVIQPMGPIEDIEPEAWMKTLNINLGGSFRWIHACLPDMKKAGWGRIINLSSKVASEIGMEHGNAYSVTKAGIEMLIRNLAHELEGTGVTANALRPGLVDTEMQTYVRTIPAEQAGEESQKFFQELASTNKLLSPTIPAKVIVKWLQEDCNGEVLSVYDEYAQKLLK